MANESKIDKFIKKLQKDLDKNEEEVIKIIENEFEAKREDILDELGRIIRKIQSKGAELNLQNANKYNRLEKLYEKLADDSEELYKGVAEVVKKHIIANGLIAGNDLLGFMNDVIPKDKKINAVINEDVIREIMNEPYSGLTLDDMLKERDRQEIILKTKREITKGFREGETYGQMSNKVANIYDGNKNKAMRILRTEGHRATETAKTKAMQASNEVVPILKKWITAGDEDVRANHSILGDMDAIPMEQDFISPAGGKGPGPGQMNSAKDDINCRCILSFRLPDEVDTQE